MCDGCAPCVQVKSEIATMRTTFVLLAALAACIGSIEASDSPASERPWTNARTTFFGRDAWSLHTGSCGYGESCIRQCSHSGCFL